MKRTDDPTVVKPITDMHRQQVRELTRDYISLAQQIYERELHDIPVMFDLKGRAAGMYIAKGSSRVIRYNPYIFSKYYDDNLKTTVPHEVAHYVVDMMYNAHRVRPHGAEWQRVMLAFGAEPKATGRYDLSGIPVRKCQRHRYHCDCSSHEISTTRHNRVLQGKARYYCRKCRTMLTPSQREK